MTTSVIARGGPTGKLERLAAPQSEVEAFLEDVASGSSPSDAARKFTRQDGRLRTSSEFGRLANRDPEFAERYAAALAERDVKMADLVDDLVARRAQEDGSPAAFVQMFAGRWNASYRWRERPLRSADDEPISASFPQIDPSRFTEGQLAELERLLMIGMGRIANPEMPVAGEVGAGEAA